VSKTFFSWYSDKTFFSRQKQIFMAQIISLVTRKKNIESKKNLSAKKKKDFLQYKEHFPWHQQ